MTVVAILGAGISGLSSGWLLQQQGIDYIILEQQSYPGGLARSFGWHGFTCDFAAHRLFTTDENILHQLLNLVPMGRHIRRSQIYLHGKWMRDPLDLVQLSMNLGLAERVGIAWNYLTRPRHLSEDNFENYVLKRYGSSLYHIFFQPYTEKLFGITGKEVSVFWARQKVRLANPLDNLRENTKNKFQYFYYPIRGGYGAITNSLYQQVKDQVFLESRVTALDIDSDMIGSIIYEHDGQEHRVPINYVISTLPIHAVGRLLGFSVKLNFQKVDAVYLLLNRPWVSDNHWLYFTDRDVCINRLVEFKNMSSVDMPTDQTVLCAEVTQHHPDVVNKVVDDLVRIGLISRGEVKDTMLIREPFAYPIYNQGYVTALQEAQSLFFGFKNLFLVGRNAEFRHREVDDNFAAAIEVVNQITNIGTPHIEPVKSRILAPTESNFPIVVAVILTFNHFDVTQECLESAMAVEYPNLRIILVDNGSQDGTPEKVKQGFPQVEVIENKQNLGVPAGYNVGFKSALDQGAEYILMLNNDTVVAPDMLAKLIKQAQSDPQTAIVMPQVNYYGSQEPWSSGGRYRRFPPAILFNDHRKRVTQKDVRLIEFAPSCALLIHRRAFEQVGLFDPGYFFNFDDWDFSQRVRAHGLHIWFVRDAKIWHKVSRTTHGVQSPLYWYTTGASMARFYRRHSRPAWLSLGIHTGYIFLREFLWKRNWKYMHDFIRGVRDGLQKPLGSFPRIN